MRRAVFTAQVQLGARGATDLYYEEGFSPAQVDPRSEADMHLLLKYTTVLLACEDDEPVGYASFYTRGPFLHLEEIAVRRDRQRRGCGRALAQQVLAEARADPQCTTSRWSPSRARAGPSPCTPVHQPRLSFPRARRGSAAQRAVAGDRRDRGRRLRDLRAARADAPRRPPAAS